jgi:uncharacterized protein YkwD
VVRVQEGLQTLQLRANLTEMARRQSFSMGLQGLATHFDETGRDPTARARQAGYPGLLLGETIADTYDGPVETLDLWLELDRTRAVLLNPAACEVGVFGSQNGMGRAWWVLVAGAPQRSRPS